jgi:hypothetical protein
MISTRAKPTRRVTLQPRIDEAAQDLAGVSATLRELALRAYHAVRAVDASESHPGEIVDRPADTRQELTELHAQILQLERILHAHALNDLTCYVTALRQEVEGRLG